MSSPTPSAIREREHLTEELTLVVCCFSSELRSVLTQVIRSIHDGTLLSDRPPPYSNPSFPTREDLVATLHHVAAKVSEQLSYCATLWVQQGPSALAWTDKEVLLPTTSSGETETTAGTNLHTLQACLAIVQCDNNAQSPYTVHSIYLGDEFLVSKNANPETDRSREAYLVLRFIFIFS